MKKHILPMLSGIALACTTATADEFLKTDAMFMDTGGADGQIMIVPFFTLVDTVADPFNAPDKLQMRFNVYTAGTTTKLLTTKTRAMSFPDVPCSNPTYVERDISLRVAGSLSTVRRHLIIDAYTECTETGTGEFKEAHNTGLYSAKLITGGLVAGGQSWLKAFNGWEVLGADGIDWDNDSTTEMMLSLLKEAGGALKSRNMFIQMSDGTIEADNIYTVLTSK